MIFVLTNWPNEIVSRNLKVYFTNNRALVVFGPNKS
jgi:hypothetical protein